MSAKISPRGGMSAAEAPQNGENFSQNGENFSGPIDIRAPISIDTIAQAITPDEARIPRDGSIQDPISAYATDPAEAIQIPAIGDEFGADIHSDQAIGISPNAAKPSR